MSGDYIRSEVTLNIKDLSVDSPKVSNNIQLIVSDLVYRMFYGSKAEIKNLQRQNLVTPADITAGLSSSFANLKATLLVKHPTINDIKFIVKDVYISKSILYTISEVKVTTTSGTISQEVEVSLPA